MKKTSNTPYAASRETIHSTTLTLYRGDLVLMTEDQRSDLRNASAFFIQRVKEYDRVQAKARAAHEESDAGSAPPPEEVAAPTKEKAKKRRKR